jgi:hypothetical protein
MHSGKPVRFAIFVAEVTSGVGGAEICAGRRGDVGYTIASSFSAAMMPSTTARTIGRAWSRTDK